MNLLEEAGNVKFVSRRTATMSGGSGSLQDLPPTSVFESPPSLLHGNGGYQADLINLTLDSPGEPLGGSPPKRTRQAESSPGGQSDSTGLEENVTMEAIARTLQHQLQQERQVLTGEIQRAMSQVNSRVDDIEKVLGDKLGDAVGMLQDLAGVQKKQGEKLETVAAETQTLANRIVDLESRLQQLEAGGGGGPRGANLLEDDAGNRKPALIIGGWDPDQPGDETLTKAQDVIRELQLDIDAEEAFVPGRRRGYAIIPFNARRGETQDEARRRAMRAVQRVRGANVILGRRGDGSHSRLWLAISQSPAKRKRAQLAAKTKRLILELGGTANRLEVEYSTGTAWYNGGKICSGTAPKPGDDATEAGAGWIDLAKIARNLGMSEDHVKAAWLPLATALR